MTTYPLRKCYYIIESVYFIYRLFILFISTLSSLLFLYTVSWRYKRDYLHANIDILLYIMFCTINTMKDINSLVPRSYLRYKKGPDLNLLPSFPPFHYLQLRPWLIVIIRSKLSLLHVHALACITCRDINSNTSFRTL